MAVPYTFGSATSSIPLSQLDSNFATAITLGNTAVYLGNTTTTLNGLTLSNVTISSGNVTITSVTLTNANITGTTTLSGLTASTALALDASKNIVSVTNTGTGNNVLAASPSLTGTVTIATLNLTNALGTTYGGTGLTSFTANGVVYASSSSALATGSVLTFDGSAFTLNPAQIFVRANTAKEYLRLGTDGSNDIYLGGSELLNITGGVGIKFNTGTGTEQMRLTSTGLGIGTSSPNYSLTSYKGGAVANYLQVASGATGAGSSNGLLLGVDSSGNSVINAQGAVNLYTYVAGVLRSTIDSSGNLGLGVTPSAWATLTGLQVKNASVSGYNNETHLSGNAFYGSSNWKYISNGYAARYSQNDVAGGAHAWFTAPTGTAGNTITFTQAMTLDASGRLLVGTTSSIGTAVVSKLQTLGTQSFITTNNEAGSFVGVNSNADNSLAISADPDNLRSNSYISFQVDGLSEKARIDSSGNLLVGATVVGSWSANCWGVQTAGGFTVTGHANGAASGSAFAYFDYNNGVIGSITQSGTTAVLYNVTSDQRLKENIQDADSASALIDSLQVRKFDWKTDQTHQRYGFVAQELASVAPEAVHQPADPEEMMAVDYSKLVPMLVKEIQSLRKRLADAGIA